MPSFCKQTVVCGITGWLATLGEFRTFGSEFGVVCACGRHEQVIAMREMPYGAISRAVLVQQSVQQLQF